MTVDDGSLRALLSLLETETEDSIHLLVEQMRDFSDSDLRLLADMADPITAARPHIDLLLAERELPRVQALLLEWISAGAPLEDGVLLVARCGYPRLHAAAVRKELDALAEDINVRLPEAESVKRLKALTYVLHQVYGFHGNNEDYRDPDNSYINRVLERRTGLPITLSVMYILLGRRLGLPITGVPLPGHFIAMLRTAERRIFFDPFHGGEVLSMQEIAERVRRTGMVFHPNHLEQADARQIVQRMFANLRNAYGSRHEYERETLVRQYLSVL